MKRFREEHRLIEEALKEKKLVKALEKIVPIGKFRGVDGELRDIDWVWDDGPIEDWGVLPL